MAKSKATRSSVRSGTSARGKTATGAGAVGLPAAAVKRARELFTAAEKRLFDSSLGHALASATHDQVQAASRQARALRDKWHALTAAQTRGNKRRAGARVDVAASRSREKLDILHGVVARLDQRLGELSASVSQSVAALGGRTTKPVRLKVDPGQKGRGKKIVTRAARRTAAKPVVPARTVTRAVAPPAAPPVARVVPSPAPSTPAKAAQPRKAERTVSKKVRNAGARAQLTALAGNQAIRFDKAKQRAAVTAAKSRRLAVQGLDTRRSGHAAARVRIKQARRDQRSR